jgi:hypothetical protein
VDALRCGRYGAGGTHRTGGGEFDHRADRADFVNFSNLADRVNFAPDPGVNGAAGNCGGVRTT